MNDLSSARWCKSSRSGSSGGECVELADLSVGVGIRESKNPDGDALIVDWRELAALLTDIKAGRHR